MSAPPRLYDAGRSWLVITLLSTSLLGACGTTPHRQVMGPGEERRVGFVVVDDDGTQPPAPTEETEAPDVDVVAPMAPVPVTELIEPGEEPRMPLDYHLRPGQRGRVVVRHAYVRTLRVGRRLDHEKHRDIRLTFDLGPVQVVGDRYRIPYLLVAAAAPPEGNAPDDNRGAANDIAREVIDAHGLLVIDTHGRTLGVSLEAPNAISPATLGYVEVIHALVGGLMVQVPREPVGIGASWRTHTQQNATLNGGDDVMTLRSLDGDEIVLDERADFTEQPQDVIGNRDLQTEPTHNHARGSARLDLGAIAQQAETAVRSQATALPEGAPASRRRHWDNRSTFSTTPVPIPEPAAETF